jgi:hypothetical protein
MDEKTFAKSIKRNRLSRVNVLMVFPLSLKHVSRLITGVQNGVNWPHGKCMMEMTNVSSIKIFYRNAIIPTQFQQIAH